MRQVNGVYTQIFNRCYKHDGPLFKGRYKSILIEADSYFMECVRYIHRNPIKVGLAGEVGEYRWTSHKCYVIKTNLQNWLCVEEALAYWGKHKKLAIKEYNDYVNQNVAEYLDKRLEGSNWPTVLGGEKFKDKIKELFLGKDLTEISSQVIKDSLPSESLEGAIEFFLDYFKISKEQYRKGQKKYYEVRDFTIRYSREKLKYKNAEIARKLNMSVETISWSYRMVRDNKVYDKILKSIKWRNYRLDNMWVIKKLVIPQKAVKIVLGNKTKKN